MKIITITPEDDAQVCQYCGKTRRDHYRKSQWNTHQEKLNAGENPPWYSGRDFLLTDEEKQYILDNIGEKTCEDIAADIGVSAPWLRNRVPTGTFPYHHTVIFTVEDDDFIREQWGKEEVRWIHKELGKDCSMSTLSRHAINNLGLPPKRRVFTVEEDDFIREWWGRLPVKTITDKLDRCESSVRRRASDLGLLPLRSFKATFPRSNQG